MRAALLALSCLSACAFNTPEPLPIVGEPPRVILILPVQAVDGIGDAARSVQVTVAQELYERGYQSVPAAAATVAISEAGIDPDQPTEVGVWADAARAVGADAMLSVRVERWDATFARPGLVGLTYDVGYRLWDVATGNVMWEVRSADDWRWQPEPSAMFDSTSEEAYLEPAPAGQDRSPYTDNRSVARVINRRAFELLPVGPLRW